MKLICLHKELKILFFSILLPCVFYSARSMEVVKTFENTILGVFLKYRLYLYTKAPQSQIPMIQIHDRNLYILCISIQHKNSLISTFSVDQYYSIQGTMEVEIFPHCTHFLKVPITIHHALWGCSNLMPKQYCSISLPGKLLQEKTMVIFSPLFCVATPLIGRHPRAMSTN